MSESNPDAESETTDGSTYAEEWIENDAARAILRETLDETDYEIYRVLNEDGRVSDTEIAERVGLSRTAVRRRREKLLDEGVLDVLAVLILQEADLAYADVRVTLSQDPPPEELESFVQDLLYEELIYEIDEYMGEYDLLVRVWHSSLRSLKQYVNEHLQSRSEVDSYEIEPVIKTRKAWHKVIE